MTLLSSRKTRLCFFDIMGTVIFSNAFLFVDSAVILVDPRRSQFDAPAILQNAPVILEDAPVIFIKQKSVRTQPPCADFSAKTPHFHAPAMCCNACARRINAPAMCCNAWARRIHAVPFFFKQWGGTNKKRSGRLLQNRTWDEMPVLMDSLIHGH